MKTNRRIKKEKPAQDYLMRAVMMGLDGSLNAVNRLLGNKTSYINKDGSMTVTSNNMTYKAPADSCIIMVNGFLSVMAKEKFNEMYLA